MNCKKAVRDGQRTNPLNCQKEGATKVIALSGGQPNFVLSVQIRIFPKQSIDGNPNRT